MRGGSARPPAAPFGRGRHAARILARVIDGAAAACGALPASVAHGLAVAGGHVEWALRPGLRRRLATNIAHVISTDPHDRNVRSLVRREVVNEARRSVDLLWAISRPDEFMAAAHIDGSEHVVTALAAGNGVVVAGLHVGGWEVAAGVPAVVIPVPTTVVVADDWLAWAIRHVRVRLGLRIAYRTDPAVRLLRVLTSAEALLILGDDASGLPPRTHRVELCGSPALLPAGIVALSRIAGAPIVTFDVLPLGRRSWHVHLGEPIAPPPRESGSEGEQRTLQRLADRWSLTLRRHPDQWAARFPIAWEDQT